MIYEFEGYLVHHGIKGQKWGIQNGPPYPLGTKISQMIKRRASARQERNLSEDDSARRKKIAKAIAIAAGLSLATYGTYKLYKSGALDKAISVCKNKEISKVEFGSTGKLLNESFGSGEIKAIPSSQVPKSMNDLFGKLDDNNVLKTPKEVQNNCVNTALAAIARMKGLDVKPGWQENGHGLDASKWTECFFEKTDKLGNSILKTPPPSRLNSYETASKWFSRYPEGSYGIFCGRFQGVDGPVEHAIFWRIENGKLVAGDGIRGLRASKLFDILVTDSKEVVIQRCDDLTINTEELLKYVRR